MVQLVTINSDKISNFMTRNRFCFTFTLISEGKNHIGLHYNCVSERFNTVSVLKSVVILLALKGTNKKADHPFAGHLYSVKVNLI